MNKGACLYFRCPYHGESHKDVRNGEQDNCRHRREAASNGMISAFIQRRIKFTIPSVASRFEARTGDDFLSMFPQLAQFSDLGFLLLRIMVGVVFLSSGWSHLKDPVGRGKSIGLSKGPTIFLGAAEVAGSLGVIFGVLTQLAALGLILIMLGAIQKKTFRVAHRFLGRKEQRMALRLDVRGYEPGHHLYRRRALGAVAIIQTNISPFSTWELSHLLRAVQFENP